MLEEVIINWRIYLIFILNFMNSLKYIEMQEIKYFMKPAIEIKRLCNSTTIIY